MNDPELREVLGPDDGVYSEWIKRRTPVTNIPSRRLVLTNKGRLLLWEREKNWVELKASCTPAEAQTRSAEMNLVKIRKYS